MKNIDSNKRKALKALMVAAEMVCILADDTGCDGDLTVTSKSSVKQLFKALTSLEKELEKQ